MDKTKSRVEGTFFLELVGIFMLPPVALYLSKTKTQAHLVVLIFAVILLLAIIAREKMNFADLGIGRKFLVSGFVPYLLFTIIGVLGIKFFANKFGFETYYNWWNNAQFLTLFIPLSIAQEFAYRSFLMPHLRSIFKEATTVILVNAGLFAMLHLFYPEPALVLPLAFIGGLGFATLYYMYPNFWLASFAHIIFNFVAVSSGFFVIVS
ncbi:MAG: CPBP family intramembrane metalloprotease [Candidatus Pacebacteria bacterium]|nr:CPBP family intramembrane metalloprotease [Candidatus Paceibacterota bacterium]